MQGKEINGALLQTIWQRSKCASVPECQVSRGCCASLRNENEVEGKGWRHLVKSQSSAKQ